jgi:hypothetical protein
VVICTLALIACLALAVAGVTGIMDGGYRPDAYAGRFDPVRAGLIVFASLGAIVLVLFAAIDILRWREMADRGSLWLAITMIGLAVAGVSMAAFFVWAPATAGPLAVPAPSWPPPIGGAFAWQAYARERRRSIAAYDRRDRKVLVSGLLLAAAVAINYPIRR